MIQFHPQSPYWQMISTFSSHNDRRCQHFFLKYNSLSFHLSCLHVTFLERGGPVVHISSHHSFPCDPSSSLFSFESLKSSIGQNPVLGVYPAPLSSTVWHVVWRPLSYIIPVGSQGLREPWFSSILAINSLLCIFLLFLYFKYV